MNTRWSAFLCSGLLTCAGPALADSQLSQLHSFGATNLAAANPYARLLQASDGALYGTTSTGGAAGEGAVFRVNPDGSAFELLKSFGSNGSDGARPLAGLIEGADGLLYGTTEEGGQSGLGTVYQMSKDATTFNVLKSFVGGSDGAYPEAGLLQGSDGMLYGTASGGGTNDYGLVFVIGKDGSGYTPLVQFNGTNGANPESELIEASDGSLYGTTSAGNASTNAGTVFSLKKDGSTFTVLKRFFVTAQIKTNGASPQARLIEGTNGMLYGTTSVGGTNGWGTVFQLNKDGAGFRTVYHFSSNKTPDARIPLGELLLGSDSLLYGTAYDGGTNGNGAIFRLAQDGTSYTVLASLRSGQGPAAALIEATNGLLYGTTQLGGDAGDGTIFALQKDGSDLAVLKSFSASGGDGRSPYAAPVSTSDNSLVGTTRAGGQFGLGSIYSLRFYGEGYAQLSSLDAVGTNASPVAPVLQLTNGQLYGVTQFGGASNNGAIFNLDPSSNSLSLVYSETASTGQELRGGLIQASDGLLYGTTLSGGSSGQGTIFRVNRDGSGYTVLQNFAFGASGPGANPLQPLLEASDGKLYGTTYFGGATNRGVLFSLAKDGSTYTVLKSFGTPATEGESPMSPLVEDVDGALYGSTYGGGSTNNAGTIFRINKDGTSFKVLLAFSGAAGDARHPSGSLALGNEGAIYGTTERGGVNSQGTLFKVNKDGSGFAVLASFGGNASAYPRGGLIKGPDGAVYGTTDQGGDLGFGTVFRYGPAFGDIVDLQVLNQVPTVTALGIPGSSYTLQHSIQLGPLASWVAISTTNAPGNGIFRVTDQISPANSSQQVFYRVKH